MRGQPGQTHSNFGCYSSPSNQRVNWANHHRVSFESRREPLKGSWGCPCWRSKPVGKLECVCPAGAAGRRENGEGPRLLGRRIARLDTQLLEQLYSPTAKVIVQFLAAVRAVQVSEPEPGAAVATGLHLGQGQQDGLNLLFGGQWSVQSRASSKSRAHLGSPVSQHFSPGRARSASTVLAGSGQSH